jgi:hypothetical protein
MDRWDVRIEIHDPGDHREHLWSGEAEDRDHAIHRALGDAHVKLGLDRRVRVTLTVGPAA